MLYVLIALLALLLLVILILTLPFTVKVYYNNISDVLSLKLSYFGINITIFPPKEKKKPKKKPEKKKTKEKPESKAKKQEDIISLKKLYEKYGFVGLIKLVESIIKSMWNILLGILRTCTIKRLNLNVKAVGEDAADTAITCGWAYSIICPIVTAVLDNVHKYNECNINITPDYREDAKHYIEADLIVSIRLFSVIRLFIENRKGYIKLIKALLESINFSKKENEK